MRRRNFLRAAFGGCFLGGAGRAEGRSESERLADLLTHSDIAFIVGSEMCPARVFLDGVEVKEVTELIASDQPGVETDGALRTYFKDAEGRWLLENGWLKKTKWRFGRIRWEPIRRQSKRCLEITQDDLKLELH